MTLYWNSFFILILLFKMFLHTNKNLRFLFLFKNLFSANLRWGEYMCANFKSIIRLLSLHFSHPLLWTLFYSSGKIFLFLFHWYSTEFVISISLSLYRSFRLFYQILPKQNRLIQRTLQNTKKNKKYTQQNKVFFCLIQTVLVCVCLFIYLILFVSSTDI